MKKKIFLLALIGIFITLLSAGCTGTSELSAPGVTLNLNPGNDPKQVSSGVQLLVLFTVLSLAPSIFIMMTSFTRIIIVLALVRNALGIPSAPPTQVLVGLALLLTIFTMSPVFSQIDKDAIQPYIKGDIDQETALNTAIKPLREFMFRQTRDKDLELFIALNKQERPKNRDDISTIVLLPAFIISELKTAFTMGFVIYVPFLIIDMVVSSVLLAMGMMMLPPSLISLPFKLLLFVLVDGWYLLAQSLVLSFK